MSTRLPSRARVLVATLAALAALDAARSVYARIGYREPVSRWRPAPDEYAAVQWPPGSDLPAGATPGRRIFLQHCQVCHGPDGRGNGPAAPSLSPRPRDFTQGEYKYKSTPAGAAPTDDDLLHTIGDGLRASAMPYFSDVLSQEELRAVAGYVKSLGPQGRPSAPPLAVPPRPPADAAALARGKALYAQACQSCHGPDGRGEGKRFDDGAGHPVAARDLTAPWTFRGGAAADRLWLRLTSGILPGPMPSYADSFSADERWDIVAYVLTLVRRAPWEPGGALAGPGADPDPVRRGDYLAHAAMCGLCHTQIDPTGIYRHDGFFLAGGMRVGAWPHPTFISRNLTGDEATGIGGFTPEQIARTMRLGQRQDRVLDPWGMPWWVLHALTEEDARAIGSFLKTLPPLHRTVPPPLEYGFVETLAGKLATPLPPAVPLKLTYADGDFADGREPAGLPRDLPQRILEVLQGLALLFGLFFFGLAGPRPLRPVRYGLGAAGVALVAFLLWQVSRLPQAIPAEPLAQNGPLATLKHANIAGLAPEQARLVARGEYLYQTTSCLLCHNGDGAGGLKISWRPFGTLYVRNISSDPRAGIGAWSDAQIARAIRSGVSRDGRQLHWQGMIWDLLSNLDEEDVRAIIAYLRTLPAVATAVPPPRPPAADDCEVYSFYLRGDSRPGCD